MMILITPRTKEPPDQIENKHKKFALQTRYAVVVYELSPFPYPFDHKPVVAASDLIRYCVPYQYLNSTVVHALKIWNQLQGQKKKGENGDETFDVDIDNE